MKTEGNLASPITSLPHQDPEKRFEKPQVRLDWPVRGSDTPLGRNTHTFLLLLPLSVDRDGSARAQAHGLP
jgi:hypothetical protein